MSIPFADVASQLQQKCEAGRVRASIAMKRAFDEPWELEVNTPSQWNPDALPEEWDSTGLTFVFQSGKNAAIVLLADTSGVAPAWCSHPNELQQDKLRTLASELATAFLPATTTASESTVGRVKNLREAVLRSTPGDNSALLSITLRNGEKSASLWVLWPATTAKAMPLEAEISTRTANTESDDHPATTATNTRQRPPLRYADLEEGISLLPSYSRSLLRIRVPVTVTLAAAKQSLQAILNIGSGSIIHFNKSCEDTLTLEVAGHKVAVGETVKVGDKFGLWITAMILPDERFWVLSSRHPPRRAK